MAAQFTTVSVPSEQGTATVYHLPEDQPAGSRWSVEHQCRHAYSQLSQRRGSPHSCVL